MYLGCIARFEYISLRGASTFSVCWHTSNCRKLLAKAADEFICVYNTLWLNLVYIRFQHSLECSAKCLFWELLISEDLLHFRNCYTSTTLCVCTSQRIVQLLKFEVHLGHIDFVEKNSVLDAPAFRVQLFHNQIKFSLQNWHTPLLQTCLELITRQ